MKKIVLIRHGKTTGKPALNGRTDVALSDLGYHQLEATISKLDAPDLIMSSPKERCAYFARRQSDISGVRVNIVDELREMDFGEWDGIPFDDLTQEWSLLESFWQNPAIVTPPGGESLTDFYQRIVSAWQTLTEQELPSLTHVYCHGGVIRMILAHLLNLDIANPKLYQMLNIQHASYTEIALSDYGAVIQCIGVTTDMASEA